MEQPQKPRTSENEERPYTLRIALMALREGIFDNNPILVQLLGTCPTLATTTSVTNAVGMGLAATFVLVFSNLFISLLRKFIPKEIRIAAYIVIITGFVSAVEMLIKAFFPALDKSLGVFIPLIAVNCIILARAEAFASKNKPLPSAVDGLTMGLGFLAALVVLAAAREIIGAGTFAGIPLFGENFRGALMFIMPPGAFIMLGCLIACVQGIKTRREKLRSQKEHQRLRALILESEFVQNTEAAAAPPLRDASNEETVPETEKTEGE